MKTKFSFILLSVFFLMSCTSPPEAVEIFPCDDQDINRVQALFNVGKVEAALVDQPSRGALPSRFTLNFKACMTTTLVSQTPLPGVDFKILTYKPLSKEDQRDNPLLKGFTIPGDAGQKQYAMIQTRTDNQGCVQWQETYNYAMPIKNRWIYFERVFENLSGQVVVPLLVNPWLHPDNGSVKLYDIRPEYATEKQITQAAYRMKKDIHVAQKDRGDSVKQCLMSRSLSQIFDHLKDKGKARLYAKTVNAVVTFPGDPPETLYELKDIGTRVCTVDQTPEICDSRGKFLNLRLSIPLKIEFESSINTNRRINVEQGQFEVTPLFIAHSEGKAYRVHRDIKPVIGEISASGENLEVEFNYINMLWNSTSVSDRFELYLKITAVGENSENIKPFYRVYSIPGLDINSLAGSKTWSERPVLESTVVHNFTRVLDFSPDTLKKLKDNAGYEQEFNSVAGGDKFDELSPEPGSNFHRPGKPALDLKRLRFFKVFLDPKNKDPEKKVCESIVERTVLYTGVITVQDYTKEGHSNLINEPVTVTVRDYTLDDNNRVVCVEDEDAPSSRFSDNKPCKEAEPISSTLDRTNEAGELQFYYKLKHKLYDRQKFYLKKFTFKVKGYSPQTKIFAFLPWEYGFLTYQDVTDKFQQWEVCQNNRSNEDNDCDDQFYVSLPDVVDARGFKDPILRFNEYRSILIEPSYEIQNSLDISTIKNSMVLLRPTIARFDHQGRTIRVAPLPLPRGYWILRMIVLKGPQELTGGERHIVSPERQKGSSFEEFKRNVGSSVQDLFQRNSYSELYDQYRTQSENLREETSYQSSGYTLSQNIFDNFEKPLQKLRSLLEKSSLVTEDIDENTLETRVNSGNFYESGTCLSPSLSPNCRQQPFDKSDYISHFDTLVYSDNSVISAFMRVKFKTEQFRFLGSKNVVILQIYPTDPGGYKYHPETCDIDLEKSTFKIFKDHDLETPPHWGLASSSDYGYFNIVRPVDEDLLEELIQRPGNEEAPLSPLEELDFSVKGDKNKKKREFIQKSSQDLQTAVNQLEELRDIFKENPSPNENMIYEIMSQIGDDLNQYCSNAVNSDSYIRSCICLGDPNRAKVRSCVQMAYQQEGVQSIRQELDNLQAYHYGKIKTESETLNKDPKKQYCKTLPKQLITGYNGEVDISQDGLDFRKCVCEDTSEDSLTLTMAKCFAQNQGLTVVDISRDHRFLNSVNRSSIFEEYNSDLSSSLWGVQEPEEESWLPDIVLAVIDLFSDDDEESTQEKSLWNYMNYTSTVLEGDGNIAKKLNNMPPMSQVSSEDMSRFIREGFNEENVHRKEEGSFLHLMCYFWFDQYYEKFFDVNRINNLYHFYQRNEKILEGQGLNLEGFRVPEEGSLNTLDFQSSNNMQKNPFTEPSWDVDWNFLSGGLTSPSDHPYYRCLKNPRYFFHFERKVMVGRLSQRSEDFKYRQGHVYTYSASRIDGADLRRGWNLRHSFSLSSGLKFSWKVFDFLRTSMEKSISESEDRTQRASESASKMVTLAVNNIQVQMGFSRYRQCLLIRPKRAAFTGYGEDIWKFNLKDRFQKSVGGVYPKDAFEFVKFAYKHFGLLLCDDEVSDSEDPLLVDENYYYIHQFWGGHYEFMSRTIYQNRPYIQILRGKNALDKFEMFTRKGDYKLWTGRVPGHLNLEQSNVDDRLIEAFNDTKLDHSGFVEGIYTYTDSEDHYLLSKDRLDTESSVISDIIEWGMSKWESLFGLSDDREIREED